MRRLLEITVLSFVAVSAAWGGAAAVAAGTGNDKPAAGEKHVRFHGYSVVVPRTWPVYNLSADPSVCVRFDRHAVYLGQPSSVQRCPAHAVGRTEAILVEPLSGLGARAASQTGQPLASRGSVTRQALGSAATFNDARSGVIVTAAWGSRSQLIEHALGARSIGEIRALALRSTAAAGATATATAPATTARATPTGGAAPTAPTAAAPYKGLGFDVCSTPSQAAMTAWKASPYRAVGVYLGGPNMACSQTNLTPNWIKNETAAGWHLIPTYVGLQAPSNSCGCAPITLGQAGTQGAAAAADAIQQAQALGLGPGTPIYDDMEYYSRTPTNTKAALAFLSAWTAGLHAAGYKSGVYGNDDSAIADMVAASGTSFQEPDDIWFANWNGVQTTSSPYVPDGYWASHQRIHQYSGGQDETYRGVTLNVDGNYLDGGTTGLPGGGPPIPDGKFVQVNGSEGIYKIAGGAPLYVSPLYWAALGPQPLTMIARQRFTALNAVPANGTFLQTSTGSVYRVAGGAPLYVSDASLFAKMVPVAIDEWDIDNIDDPAAHLRSAPANGTFLRTTTGKIYRVAGGTPFPVAGWSVFGRPQPFVTVDQWDIKNIANPAAHLSATPLDGTTVEGLPSTTYWVFTGGRRRLTGTNPEAVQLPDSGVAAFAGIPCVVPPLRGDTLGQARGALFAADCRTGSVHNLRAPSPGHPLHVVSQSSPAATTQPAGYPVVLTLG